METSQDNDNSNDESNKSTKQGNGSSSAQTQQKTIDLIAETANQIIDAFGWLGHRLNASGSVFKIEDARGELAEVTLPIPPDGLGEVTLVLGKMRKSYPAKAVKPGQEFQRGSKVRITDVAVSTMYVDCA